MKKIKDYLNSAWKNVSHFYAKHIQYEPIEPFLKATLSVFLVVGAFNLGGCNYRKVPEIQAEAPEFLAERGFEILFDEGFMLGTPILSPGGKVFYKVRNLEQPDIWFELYLAKRQGRLQMYSFKPIPINRTIIDAKYHSQK